MLKHQHQQAHCPQVHTAIQWLPVCTIATAQAVITAIQVILIITIHATPTTTTHPLLHHPITPTHIPLTPTTALHPTT